MNKGDLVAAMADSVGISKLEASRALDAMTSSITHALAQNDKVSLVGWGTFSTSDRPERVGRNPRTGEAITIAARKVVKFKPGKALSVAVNS